METLANYKKLIQRELLPKLEKIETDVSSLKEEWEVMKNPKLVGRIEESLRQKRKGKLHSWEEFKRIIDKR
ncbi:MAG: hypothetical protein HY051_02325 [Candidatus Aenigmarchaeota archaeon]|nr:hypothetical protein [Candidatus Aenigmarchaeota archaeon]